MVDIILPSHSIQMLYSQYQSLLYWYSIWECVAIAEFVLLCISLYWIFSHKYLIIEFTTNSEMLQYIKRIVTDPCPVTIWILGICYFFLSIMLMAALAIVLGGQICHWNIPDTTSSTIVMGFNDLNYCIEALGIWIGAVFVEYLYKIGKCIFLKQV